MSHYILLTAADLPVLTYLQLTMDMDAGPQQAPAVNENNAEASGSSPNTNNITVDLVGGPFAVIESDPGELTVLFTGFL